MMGKALKGELSCPCDRSCFYDGLSCHWGPPVEVTVAFQRANSSFESNPDFGSTLSYREANGKS